jgi:hypothetical protein
MARTLGWIATFGLGIGIVSLALAYALGGRDFDRLVDHSGLFAQTCSDNVASISERHLPWTGGDAIDIALPATVRFRGGEGHDIVLRGAPNTIAHVELHGRRLTLNCGWAGARDLEVTLPGQAFRRVSLSGSGKLALENLNQPELALNISGSGTLRGQGTVDQLTIKLAGSGNARLADLAVKHLTVKISGSGNVEAAPKDEADIAISGSGDVRLLSRPARLKTHISGSGRITQAALEAAEGKK